MRDLICDVNVPTQSLFEDAIWINKYIYKPEERKDGNQKNVHEFPYKIGFLLVTENLCN